MKTIKFEKKLNLNKQTVTALNSSLMNHLIGGGCKATNCSCKCDDVSGGSACTTISRKTN